jgi:hypothetical protein
MSARTRGAEDWDVRTERYHDDGALPLTELKAMRVLASRLREKAEQATALGFDVVASAEIDRLLMVEGDLRDLIAAREREEASAA